MDFFERFLLFFGLGLAKGVHDRTNDAMLQRGERVSWARRHVILSLFLWTLVGIPVVIEILLNGPTLLLWVAEFDRHHGNTGLIDLLVFTSPLWIWGITAYINAERRWARQPHSIIQPEYYDSQVIDITPALSARPDVTNYP